MRRTHFVLRSGYCDYVYIPYEEFEQKHENRLFISGKSKDGMCKLDPTEVAFFYEYND